MKTTGSSFSLSFLIISSVKIVQPRSRWEFALFSSTVKTVFKRSTPCLAEFANYRSRNKGLIAISFKDGDSLLDALLTSGSDEIMIAGRDGHFAGGRPAGGAAGIHRAVRLHGADLSRWFPDLREEGGPQHH